MIVSPSAGRTFLCKDLTLIISLRSLTVGSLSKREGLEECFEHLQMERSEHHEQRENASLKKNSLARQLTICSLVPAGTVA
jgi:hypothetical protein